MSLSSYNWTAFGVHLCLAIFFSVYFPIINEKFPQNPQLRNQMAMKDHKVVLSKDSQNRLVLGWSSATTLSTSLTTVQGLLIAFFYITALFHLIYATSSIYPSLIKNNNNWLRWVEYSITSTLMIYIIALICTVKDTHTYILLGVCNITMILLGQFVEEKIKNKESALLPLSMSFFILFSEFGIIFREASNRLQQINAYVSPNQTKPTEFPLWIFFMVPILFLFFGCFGGVALFQSFFPDTDYESIEKIYILLSLVAKTTLGGFLAYGSAWGQQKFS
jgi:hypothetical protein